MAESDVAFERRRKAASVAVSEETHSGDDRTVSSDSPVMRHTSLSTQERQDINDIVDTGFATPIDEGTDNDALKTPSRPGHMSPSPLSTPVKSAGQTSQPQASDNPQTSQAPDEPAIDIGFYGDGGLTAWDGVAARRRSQEAPEPVTFLTRREEALSRDEANVEDLSVDIGFYGDGGLTAWDHSGQRRRSLEAPEILPPELEDAAARDHAKGPALKPSQQQRPGGVSPEPSVVRRDVAPNHSLDGLSQQIGSQRIPPTMQQPQTAYYPGGQSQAPQNRSSQQGSYLMNATGQPQTQQTGQAQNTRGPMPNLQSGQLSQHNQPPAQAPGRGSSNPPPHPPYLDQSQRKHSGGAPVSMSGALPQGSPQVSRTDTVYSADVRPKGGSQFPQGAPRLTKDKKKRISLFAGLFKSDPADPSGKKRFGKGKSNQPQMVPSQYAVPPPHMLNQQHQQGHIPGSQNQGTGPQQFPGQPQQPQQQQQLFNQPQQPWDAQQQQQFYGQVQQSQSPQPQYQVNSVQKNQGLLQHYQGRPDQFQGGQPSPPPQAMQNDNVMQSPSPGQQAQPFQENPIAQPRYLQQPQSASTPPPGQHSQPIPFYQTQSPQQPLPSQHMQPSTSVQPYPSTQGQLQAGPSQSIQQVQPPQQISSTQTQHPMTTPTGQSVPSSSQSPQSAPSPEVTQKQPEMQQVGSKMVPNMQSGRSFEYSQSSRPAQSTQQTPTKPQATSSLRSSEDIEQSQMNVRSSQPVPLQNQSDGISATSIRQSEDGPPQPKLYWDETQQAYTTQSPSKPVQAVANRQSNAVSATGLGRESTLPTSTFPTRFGLPLSGTEGQRTLPRPPSPERSEFLPPPGPPPGWMDKQDSPNGPKSAPVSKFAKEQRWTIANPSGHSETNVHPYLQQGLARGSFDQGMPPRAVPSYLGQSMIQQTQLGVQAQPTQRQSQGASYHYYEAHPPTEAMQQPSIQQKYKQLPQPQEYASQSQSSMGQQSSVQDDGKRFSFASESDQAEILNVVHAPAQPVRPTQVTMSNREGMSQTDARNAPLPPPPANASSGWRSWGKRQ